MGLGQLRKDNELMIFSMYETLGGSLEKEGMLKIFEDKSRGEPDFWNLINFYLITFLRWGRRG